MKKVLSLVLVVLTLFSLAACSSSDSGAETAAWPTQDVQIVCPNTAGSGVDSLARMVAASFEAETGESFIVTNKSEGNGIIGMNELVSQDPDGYNLSVCSIRDIFGHITNEIDGCEYTKESYTYIATLLETADSIFAQTDKFQTFDQMIEFAKENPGELTIATANTTGLQSLNILCDALDIEVSGVSYSSGSDAYADILGGHVDGAMIALSFYASGKDGGIAPVLTVTQETFTIEGLGAIPCVSDYGVPEASNPAVRVLVGPAGMDQELVDTIVSYLDVMYADGADLSEAIIAQYDDPRYLTGADLDEFIEDNYQFRLDLLELVG